MINECNCVKQLKNFLNPMHELSFQKCEIFKISLMVKVWNQFWHNVRRKLECFYCALSPLAEGSSIFPTNNRDPLDLSFMKNINGRSILISRKSENDNGTKSMPRNVLIFFRNSVISFFKHYCILCNDLQFNEILMILSKYDIPL